MMVTLLAQAHETVELVLVILLEPPAQAHETVELVLVILLEPPAPEPVA
jgi:hypothetical protein